MNIDWSEAPVWAEEVGQQVNGGCYAWMNHEGYCFQGVPNPTCHPYGQGTYYRHGFKIVATRKWDGEGLPPVGAVCEHEGSNGWTNSFKVEVIAHKAFKGHGDDLLVVFTTEDDVYFSSACCFRPCLTPEQIKAKERDEAIHDLMGTTCITMGEASLIYDAGWRKLV